jgi:hypothetical protein
MEVTISEDNYPLKPKGNINSPQCFKNITIEAAAELAKLCGDGYAIRTGLQKPGTNFTDANVINCPILALDFDGGETKPEEVIEFAAENFATPNFMYYSYSQDPAIVDFPQDFHFGCFSTEKGEYKPGYRFRLVWCHEKPISKKDHKALYPILVDMFKNYKIDKCCGNPSRMFYGSKLGYQMITDDFLPNECVGVLLVEQKKKNNISNRSIKNSDGCVEAYLENIPDGERVYVDKHWKELLYQHCELWRKYTDGEYLEYYPRLRLFTNLKFLSYKSHKNSIRKDILDLYREETWEGHSFDYEQLDKILRDRSMKPYPIVNYRGKEMAAWEFFKEYDGEAAVVPQVERISPEEVRDWMKENIPLVLADDGSYYVKSQTGSGKTEMFLNYIAEESFHYQKIVIASPTHELSAQSYERLLEIAPDLKDRVYKLPKGNYSERDEDRLYVGLKAETPNPERAKILNKLYSEKEQGIFFITHQTLVHLRDTIPVDLIIVDENIEEALITSVEFGVDEMAVLNNYLDEEGQKRLSQLKENMLASTAGDMIDNPFYNCLLEHIDSEAYVDEASIYIKNLFLINKLEQLRVIVEKSRTTERDVWSVRGISRSPLINNCIENNVPLKLFSATPMPQIIRSYYNMDFEEVSAPLAKNTGKIIQYARETGRRGSHDSTCGMNKRLHKKYAQYMKSVLGEEKCKNLTVISYMNTKDMWIEENFFADNTHFGNCAGLNKFKGQDLAVVGKPDRPDSYYRRLWYEIRPEGDKSEPERVKQTVVLNGVEQTLFLYKQEELRNAQLEYYEFQINQAVGRARAFFEDATVYLFCNYTPSGVDEIYY